ncbi:MAG: ArnT family glycosyltransferase [Bradymonadia bacterium]
MDTQASLRSFRADLGVGALLILLSLWTVITLGIWEPWEADAARVVRNMLESGRILAVNSGSLDQPNLLNQMPFGWWGHLLSMWIFGESELSLRLPSLLLFCALVVTLYRVVLLAHGQTLARFAALFAIATPSMFFQGILAHSTSVSVSLIALTCLTISAVPFGGLSSRLNTPWTIALLVACATLTSGLIGLLLPMIVGFAITKPCTPLFKTIKQHALPIGIFTLLVCIGLWRASAYRPDGMGLVEWLSFTDGLGIERKTSLRPAFSLYVHQIGFGLFPWGVLAPLAFAYVKFNARWSEDINRLHIASFVWFAGAFVYGSICYSWTHYAFFLGAPALALVLAPFFAKLLATPEKNGFTVLVIVLLVGLLDSNLKHEPRLLAEAFVGTNVDIFPGNVWYSFWGRMLNVSLLGICILFGTNLLSWAITALQTLLYPKVSPTKTSFHIFMSSILVSVIICSTLQKSIIRSLNRIGFNTLMPWAKVALTGVLIAAFVHFVIYVLWRWRHQAPPHDLSLNWFSAPRRSSLATIGIAVIAFGWIGMNQLAVATTMTRNFSQRGLLNQYETYRHALGDAPLFTYELSDRDRSYYARDLDKMDLKTFQKLCRENEPFFAVIPQKNLSKVNERFRAATRTSREARENHIPVLYAGGARFYLVTNKLPEGAEDLNPMKRAFLESEAELPDDVNKVDINFEDKVKIIGWKVEPRIARRGAPMKMVVYWKVLKNRVGSWKVFVHMDAPGQRIHGDHDPVSGLLPTTNWRAGDLIVDEHTVRVDRTKSPANFTFYTGLFRGDKRLKVNDGPQDGKNRAKLGIVRLK